MLCTRRFEFDSGHRVLGHGGKCKYLHGHRYVADVTCHAEQLDKLGMVIDFSDIKKIVGDFIDTHWDHNIILNPADPLAQLWLDTKDATLEDPSEMEVLSYGIFGGKAPWLMPVLGMNPTAENLAAILSEIADGLLQSKKIRVTNVVLYETPNSFVPYANPYFHPKA